jgi:putative heme transporter
MGGHAAVAEQPTTRTRRLVRAGLVVAACVAAVIALRHKVPTAHDLIGAIRTADVPWLLAGLVAEYVSLAMFARQQQWLLRGLGVPTRIGPALAVTYSRSAIAISLPAGSAVSAGFAYQTFRRWGASPQVATAVMVISGIQSTAGLALLYLFGFLAVFGTDPGPIWQAYPVGTVAAVATTAALAVLAAWGLGRRAPTRPPTPAPVAVGGGPVRRRLRQVVGMARDVAATAAAMPARHKGASLAFAVANWLADLCCLAAVARAFDLPLTFTQLAIVYLGVQLVRQIPVTPGGMGVIEASLLAALVAAGAGEAPAAAAVLGYRLFSCWLIIPAGLFTWTMLRRRPG